MEDLWMFLLSIILCVIIISSASKQNSEEYELTSETIIVDKFITYRASDAKPYYYLIYKDENGTICQEHVNPDIYYRFEIDEEKGE